jgi:hypothetical protein
MWNYITSLAATVLALLELAKDWHEHKTTVRRAAVLILIMLVGIGGAISTYYSDREADRRHSEDQAQIAKLQKTVETGNETLKQIVLLLQPQLKQTTPSGPYTVSLSWKASGSSDAVAYNIYRSNRSGGPYIKLGKVPATTTSYEDEAVTSGSTYYYVVTAVNSRGFESAFSNEQRRVVPVS